jgi:hypothetical protein
LKRVLGKTSRGRVARGYRPVAFVTITVLVISASFQLLLGNPKTAHAFTVPGQSYEICNDAATYLTSPWNYSVAALPVGMGSPGTGSEAYSVSQYENIAGYGTALPPLPAYIANESTGTEAAIIFTPGAQVGLAAYDAPETPVIYFFEGGAYTNIALESISGDEFIGGSGNGYAEPQFDDQTNAEGIDSGNGTYYFSGGSSTLAGTYSNTNMITTTSPIPGYIQWLTFADGSTYQIQTASGDNITLTSNISGTESAGSDVWANQSQPLAEAASSAVQGATSLTLTSSSVPMMQYASVIINNEAYTVNTVSGSQSGYTLGFTGGLDMAVPANAPIYYNAYAGAVTVEYLDISNDQHNTTGTIYTGVGWTIEHNNIHDGNSKGPGNGVALYGGDQGTIEYNCLSKMGDYGVNIFGTNDHFDYNEIYESNYQADPGCGCSGAGKWWGTLNADVVDNAFINDGIGGGGAVWLDNGNAGTNISGNFFDMTDGGAISEETGFNLSVTDNYFLDNGWDNGSPCGGSDCNNDGTVNINSSGGFNIPGSRYENEIAISGNQFENNWMGVDIWQSGGRSCQNSGEGWPADAPYCSGGFPNTATTAASPSSTDLYDFSHVSDSARGGTQSLVQAANSGSSTILVSGSEAINDYIGFDNGSTATTSDTSTGVTSFTGSQSMSVDSTSGFPTSGQLSVGTTGGGAILAYTGTTGTSFTGVILISGSGTLSGSVAANDPATTQTSDGSDVTGSAFTGGTATVNTTSTSGFPATGQLRVGTSDAWSTAGGSSTGAILSYTGTTATSFTGVSLVRGTGTLSGPIQQVQQYEVTGETCYQNDCAVTLSTPLTSNEAAGTEISNAGTCQIYATAGTMPSTPGLTAPDGVSYWDGCQWQAKEISVNNNTFIFQPSQIAASSPLVGGGSTTVCSASNNYSCGSNFMQFQTGAGDAPFNDQTGSNAMMSSSSFTGCPGWDLGCTPAQNPLLNVNALTNPPGAPASNGEAPYNDLWTNNTYVGPWVFYGGLYGNCQGGGLSWPTDPNTSKTMPNTDCTAQYPLWQSTFQQDTGSTYNPMALTLSGINANQEIQSSAQSVKAFEDTATPNTISSTVSLGSTSVQTLTSSPFNFSVNTLGFADGAYNLKVAATDSGSNSNSQTVPVYVSNGDLNGDGVINLSDLAVLAAHYGAADSNYSHGNITGQSTINLSDLAILAANWGWSHP